MPETKPNLIWIFGDQHRGQALGFLGDPNVSTPNLDRLATGGVYFDNALVNCPLCCPSRGTLLTSRYPHEAVPGHEYLLEPQIPTVAHAFNDGGYRTAWFGKWHLDGFKERTGRAAFHTVPRERRGGFQTWVGYENNNSQWDCWVHGHEGDVEVERERLGGYETDALTDRFIAYLESCARESSASQAQPFFAALSVQPPHDPFVAPERWMQGKGTARIQFRPNVPDLGWLRQKAGMNLAGYYAAIENLDWNVGRIIEALERLNLFANTHVIFFSDHGDMQGSHGQSQKTTAYNESIRVPTIIGGIDSYYNVHRGRSDALISNVDLAPTSLGLCGLPIPSGMRGMDFSGLRIPKGPRPRSPDSAFLQLVVPVRHVNAIDRPWRGIVTHDGWKYVCLEGQPWLMFNLNDDPYELINVAYDVRFEAQRARLQDRLRQWIDSTGDKFTLPKIDA